MGVRNRRLWGRKVPGACKIDDIVQERLLKAPMSNEV